MLYKITADDPLPGLLARHDQLRPSNGQRDALVDSFLQLVRRELTCGFYAGSMV